MDPTIWGPHGWFFLHSVTMNYPEKPTPIDMANYKQFFQSLKSVLPCSTCQNNFTKHSKKFDLDNALQSRDMLVSWLFNIHNEANRTLNKKQITFDEFLDFYKKEYSGAKSNTKKKKEPVIVKTQPSSQPTSGVIIHTSQNYIPYLIIVILLLFIYFRKN
jgi:hypothetical protein